ncbi:CaiB/BaiF CoA-transferase family protein [Paenibacillus sp. YYML68]|uniref:CaiB/BaiF CoA-transferase family protein n=1 Tax=Paenibacillus sp. YYML68 TaxID=2909250 RepID=UPI002493A878|nr:CaiB/BaiF CoA-transferase family protein [Paenibacillus sp. YYML68]
MNSVAGGIRQGGSSLPLDGLVVLELGEQLAVSFAALRLAELGARVIKLETAGGSDRLNELWHRGKERYSYDKSCGDAFEKLKRLIGQADVFLRSIDEEQDGPYGIPDAEAMRSMNPRVVCGIVTSCGYVQEAPWASKQASELVIQSLTGMPWLNGNEGDPPMPFPISVVELFTSSNLVQGILSALLYREATGEGMRVDVSLLESALDFQFEVLTTHLNDGGKLPQRSRISNAHAYLGAPYGIYETQHGYVALAMGSVTELGRLLECASLAKYTEAASWFTQRDEIKRLLAEHLLTRTASEWVGVLEPAGYWCARLQTVDELLSHEGFTVLQMLQQVRTVHGTELEALRCPIRLDGERLAGCRGLFAPGYHTASIDEEFELL